MSGLTTTDRLQSLLPQLFSSQKLEGDYYLKLQLTKEISGLVDLKYVQESLTIDRDRLTAVPNLPEYVVGLMSSRNQVFLAMDLAHLAGLTPETVNLRQYQTIVVQLNSSSQDEATAESDLFGLTVKEIRGIVRILPHQFATPTPKLPDSLASFIGGSILQHHSDREQLSSSSAVAQVSDYAYLIDLPQLILTKTRSQN